MTLLDRIYFWANKVPDRPAIVWNGQSISYARFSLGIDALRRAFSSFNLPAGSTAVVAVHSLLDCWTVTLALRSLGLHTVAVMNLDSALALGLSGVSCVVTDPSKREYGAGVRESWSSLQHIKISASIFSKIGNGPLPAAFPQTQEVGGHLIYTSGTTGKYKLLLQSSQGEADRSEMRAANYEMREDQPWFVGNLGLWTAVGYRMPLLVWGIGGHVVFDQRDQWPSLFLQKPCDTLLVPAMVSELLAQATEMHSLGNWQLLVSAGFLSTDQARSVLTRLTSRLEVIYGSSELLGTALRSKVSDVDDMHWLSQQPGRELEIIDDQGLHCADGVEGLLRVRLNENDAKGYLNDELASSKVFEDGYFYPGDMAVRRADGRIRVLGRNADVLNFKGRKLAVAPVEQAIQDLLGVSAVCIFSGIDTHGLEEVVVVWEADNQPAPGKLEELRQQLKFFDRVRFVWMPVFPRTSTGTSKINRRALRRHVFGPNSKNE